MNGASEASVVEALDWLRDVGWSTASGRDSAPDGEAAEREDYAEAHLPQRLRSAIERLNPGLPAAAQEDACRALA